MVPRRTRRSPRFRRHFRSDDRGAGGIVPAPMSAAPRKRSETTAPEADIVSVLGEDGALDPKHDPHLTDEEVLGLYKHLVETRLLDERFVALQRQGRVGFHVGSLGEEAAILGSA